VTFHYLFPQVTMGLSLIIFILATIALRTGRPHFWNAATFLTKLLAIGFAAGVATGIPMEFQFGTNWAHFSAYSGSIIGQTLALEGVVAFFLESIFLGLLLFQTGLGPFRRWAYITAVFVGSWISGFFITATNAWMQHPVGYRRGPGGSAELSDLWAMLSNPWLVWQYPHTMNGALITGAFVVAGIGAFYLLAGWHEEYGRRFVQVGVIMGCIASILQLYPLGDSQGRNVARYQPVTLSAMEGLFESEEGAPIAILGQPNMETLELNNPVVVPKALSFLTYRSWNATILGLKAYPKNLWPDQVPLLYYSYHIMVGLGTIFIAVMALAAYALWRGVIYRLKPLLWALLIISPFPFVSNSAGWLTAELGRQPWLVYGLLHTPDGASPHVRDGDIVFTLLGFMGAYLIIGLLVLFLVGYEIVHGPEPSEANT
jgi:cytochrome d ubiquinol oxidase subunit I